MKYNITVSRRMLLWISILCCLAFLSACGDKPSYSDLRKRNAELETEISTMNQKIEGLEKDIDELKNGSDRRISEIRAKYQGKEYDTVLKLSLELEELHPGSKEYVEAKGYVSEINKIKEEEKRIAEQEAEKKRKQAADEEERKRKEAEKIAKEKAREIIRVSKLIPSKPNSDSGVDLYITFQNKSPKEIKYAYFIVVPYNAVGDRVRCTITGESEAQLRDTGPIKQGQTSGSGGFWECVWYNSTITEAKITEIKIDYMDGSTALLSGDDIGYVMY